MASYTPNYNLKKPADSDYYDIADDNGNMDKIDTALNTLNANIGNCKIINSKYYTSATTVATVQTDIDTAIAPYVESGKPKFMEFGYMSGTAGQSIGLKDGCFINVWFNGATLVLVEFVSMTLNEVNYMRKVSNWSNIESSLNANINGIKNAKELGNASSLSTLQTYLATEAALMPTNGVEPIEVYCSSAFETFKIARYIGQLRTNYNNGTRIDFTVTLTSGNGDAITIARLNGAWSYTDLNSKILTQDVSNNINITATDIAISSLSAYRAGNVVSIAFVITTTAAFNANDTLFISATFSDNALKPKNRQPGSSNNIVIQSVNISPTSTGADLVARTTANIASGFVTWICYTYICNG